MIISSPAKIVFSILCFKGNIFFIKTFSKAVSNNVYLSFGSNIHYCSEEKFE